MGYLKSLHRAGMGKKTVIVVHNFKDLDEEGDVNEFIEKDIVKGCKAERDQMCSRGASGSDTNVVYWIGQDTKFTHVVMGKNDSEAGRKWNAQTLRFMSQQMQALRARVHGDTKLKPLLATFYDNTITVLPKYFDSLAREQFRSPEKQEGNEGGATAPMYQICIEQKDGSPRILLGPKF